MIQKRLIKTLAMLTAITCLTGCTGNLSQAPGGLPQEGGSPAQGATSQAQDADSPTGSTGASAPPSGSYTPAPAATVKLDTSSLLSTNLDLVDHVSQAYPGENVMISGMSLNYALAMLGNGASPEALSAIEDFLGTDIASANSFYAEFLNREETDTQNKLVISNSFWTDENLPYDVKESYTDLLEETYQATINTIPMNEAGVKKVNKWADKATDGLIKNALSKDDLTPDTVSILINAILLDGKWQSPFKADRTRDVEFTLADGSKTTVEGMHSEEYFYYENAHATGFRKDYEDGEYYMVAILPKEAGDFTLTDLDVNSLLKSGKSTSELNAELNIMLPKTDFEAKYNLSDILKSAGLEQIFDKSAHNLPGIYDNDDPDFRSYASSIIQNDRLIIDETGTKAAAVTSIMVENCTAAFEQKTILRVYLNRPFAILLMDGATDEPLFVAKIMNP